MRMTLTLDDDLARAFRVEPASLGGVAPGIDLDRALQLADSLEDAEIARQLELK